MAQRNPDIHVASAASEPRGQSSSHVRSNLDEKMSDSSSKSAASPLDVVVIGSCMIDLIRYG